MGMLTLMDIARTALATSQRALAVTSHNIANINTPGYSRQEAVLGERDPEDARTGQLGTGVTIQAIRSKGN